MASVRSARTASARSSRFRSPGLNARIKERGGAVLTPFPSVSSEVWSWLVAIVVKRVVQHRNLLPRGQWAVWSALPAPWPTKGTVQLVVMRRLRRIQLRLRMLRALLLTRLTEHDVLWHEHQIETANRTVSVFPEGRRRRFLRARSFGLKYPGRCTNRQCHCLVRWSRCLGDRIIAVHCPDVNLTRD